VFLVTLQPKTASHLHTVTLMCVAFPYVGIIYMNVCIWVFLHFVPSRHRGDSIAVVLPDGTLTPDGGAGHRQASAALSSKLIFKKIWWAPRSVWTGLGKA
jgi:hypothetical protein